MKNKPIWRCLWQSTTSAAQAKASKAKQTTTGSHSRNCKTQPSNIIQHKIPKCYSFSVTRRSRSDSRYWVILTHLLTQWSLALTWLMWPWWVMIPIEDLTDITLAIEDTDEEDEDLSIPSNPITAQKLYIRLWRVIKGEPVQRGNPIERADFLLSNQLRVHSNSGHALRHPRYAWWGRLAKWRRGWIVDVGCWMLDDPFYLEFILMTPSSSTYWNVLLHILLPGDKRPASNIGLPTWRPGENFPAFRNDS